jgi:hypothetical protein
MLQNKIVLHYQDGRIIKGFTADFLPTKDVFHLIQKEGAAAKPSEVRLGELKAVFFVKDYAGNPRYNEKKEFDSRQSVVGRKVRVLFKDGEILVGTTQSYQPNRSGFFFIPADTQSNIERCFIVSSATQSVSFD